MTWNNAFKSAYFGSWSSHRIPFVPQEPISEIEAKRRESYYIAYYNADEQIICFEKYLNDQLAWKDEYIYWDNGHLKTRVMSKSDGEQIIQQFNNQGRVLFG